MNDSSGAKDPAQPGIDPPQEAVVDGGGAAPAVRLLTWWRCGGCVMVIVLICVGVLLGVFSMVSSSFFAVEPLVPVESGATPGEGNALPAEEVAARNAATARIKEATAQSKSVELQPEELTAAIMHWFQESDLAGNRSGFECSYEAPGQLRVKLSYEVPLGLRFPGGMLAGRFFNADLTVSGTLRPDDPSQLLIRRYVLGTSEEVTDPEAGTAAVLGDTLGRFLRYHPDLLDTLGAIEEVTIGPQRIRVQLSP